jgi:hypothetical protein
MLFTVIRGVHVVGRGKNRKAIKAGILFESDIKLDELYKNKFKRMLLEEQLAKEKSKNKKGKKVEDEDLEDEDDDVEESDEDEDEDEEVVVREAVESKLGVDVSDDFDTAAKAGLVVLKNKKGKFFVADDESVDVALSPKGGITEVRVEKFIAKYLK